MSKGIIYRIVNRENGRWYIGSTTNSKIRFIEHASGIANKNHPNKKLRADSLIYNPECFEITVLSEFENVSKLILLLFEMKWIKSLCGHVDLYNINHNTVGFEPKTILFETSEEKALYRSLRKAEGLKINDFVLKFVADHQNKVLSQKHEFSPF